MTCPLCGNPTMRAYRPFCSRRCADIDLGRWMTGGYSLPSTREDPPEADPGAAEEDGKKIH